MSLAIDLAFSIFVLDNGEGSWSMWVFHLLAFYDFFSLFTFNTKIPFAFSFQLHCDISNFVDVLFPLTYRNSMMRSGQTCPIVIWQKLCITSGCSSQENATFVYTQWHFMTMFMLSNSLCCINNTYKVV
jgi:hypothetical protein